MKPVTQISSVKLRLLGLPAVLAVMTLILAQSTSSNEKREITFTRDAAPILFKNCAECHRPNGVAPFSVLSYKDARPWARSIREKVLTREMPPWHADPQYGDFRNVARLSRNDVDTIVSWVDQGAKEGDTNTLPAISGYADGWRIGTPDQVFSMTDEYTIMPAMPDSYVYFTIPTRFREDKWIQSAEIRPSNQN